MRLPYAEQVVLLHGVSILDPYSQQETGLDWTMPDETPIDGCVVYPAGSPTETHDVGQEQARETLTVLLPAGHPPITPDDRLRVRGNDFDVVGFPFEYVHPMTGWAPGSTVTVTRTRG